MQSIPPTTANKQTQSQKSGGRRIRKLQKSMLLLVRVLVLKYNTTILGCQDLAWDYPGVQVQVNAFIHSYQVVGSRKRLIYYIITQSLGQRIYINYFIFKYPRLLMSRPVSRSRVPRVLSLSCLSTPGSTPGICRCTSTFYTTHRDIQFWVVSYCFLLERDFTAFIKPGGFLGRNQTKSLTKKEFQNQLTLSTQFDTDHSDIPHIPVDRCHISGSETTLLGLVIYF